MSSHSANLIAKIDDILNNTRQIFMVRNLEKRLYRLRDKAALLEQNILMREISPVRVTVELNQLVAHLKDIARKYDEVDNLQFLLSLEERALEIDREYQTVLNNPEHLYLRERLEQVRKNPTVPNAELKLIKISNELRQIVGDHNEIISKLETTYRDVLSSLAYANLQRWLEEVRRNPSTSNETLSNLETKLQNAQQVQSGNYPTNTTYDHKQFKIKMRKHMEQIDRTAKELGIEIRPQKRAKATSLEVQKNIQTFFDSVVQNGETRQIGYKNFPDALWSRWGNAIVVRKSDGKFISFFDGTGGGQATNWL